MMQISDMSTVMLGMGGLVCVLGIVFVILGIAASVKYLRT
jgi:hypothetical protein